MMRWGAFYSGFRPACWWFFGVCHTIHGVFLAIVSVLLARHPDVKNILTICVLVSYCVLLVVVQPYDARLDLALDLINMVISILAIVLGILQTKDTTPGPSGFVQVSMWAAFVLTIFFSSYTLWPIGVLAWEWFKEIGASLLVRFGFWNSIEYLDQVIRTAIHPVSKIPSRLGTKKKRQTERYMRLSMLVEKVRRNLMRGVERRRAAKRVADDNCGAGQTALAWRSFCRGRHALHRGDCSAGRRGRCTCSAPRSC